MSLSTLTPASDGRLDLDGVLVAPLTICVIGAGRFICSHLCKHLMAEIPDSVLAVDVYCYKICRLVDPPPLHLACCSNFHRVNVKNDPGMEGLVKMANLEKLPDELIAREVVINDADPSVRHKLTKRQTQGEPAYEKMY